MGLTRYPSNAAAMAAACGGFGTWTAGYLCDDLASPMLAAFGGNNLPQFGGGGSPIYQVPGPLGDKAVRISVTQTGFEATSTSFLDVDNTMDICGAIVMRSMFPLAVGGTTVLSKDDFSGGPGYELGLRTDNTMVFTADHSTPGNVIVTVGVPDTILMSNEWFAAMWGMDRGAGAMRIAIQSLASGASAIGAPASISGIGSLTNTSPFRIHRSGAFGATFEVAALYIGVGVGAASGLSAGLATALQSFCDTIRQTSLTASYADMLLSLLPPGKLWRFVGSTLYSFALGCADELVRVHNRVQDFLIELDPSTADETLPDYERVLGLTAAATNEERRANIVGLLIRRQRFRPVDFQNALAALLAQAPADVVVLERSVAFCASIGDQREIYRFFIYRDPGLPGTPFIASAQSLVDSMKPLHTVGHVIESVSAKYDDPHSLYDRDLLGA